MNIAQVTGTTASLIGQTVVLKDGSRASAETVAQWSEAERNAAGLYTVAAVEAPKGKRVVSSALVYKKGQGVTLKPVYEPEDKRGAAARALAALRTEFIDAQLTGADLPAGFNAYAGAVAEIAKAEQPYTDELPEKPESAVARA